MVLAIAVISIAGPHSILIFSFGVFLKPLAQEFHTGRAAVSLAFTLQNLVSAAAALLVGKLLDRLGPRKVILPALTVMALLLIFMQFCSSQIWQFYVFFLAVGLMNPAVGPLSYGYVVSHWFDRQRGLALGLMMSGFGLGALLMPSVAQRMVTAFGWRAAYSAVGAVILLISMPTLAWLLKGKPEELGLVPDGDNFSKAIEQKAGAEGLAWREAWSTRTSWVLLGSVVLMSASAQACLTHLPAIFSDRGSTAQAGALASSLFGAGVLAGRLASGYLLDRLFAPYFAAATFAVAACGIVLLRSSPTQGLAFLAALLVGLAMGAEVDFVAFLTSRYFGLRFFGQIYGSIFAGFVLAGAVGAYLMGLAYDAWHTYTVPLAYLAGAAAFSAALMTQLGPYRYAPKMARATPPGEPALELSR